MWIDELKKYFHPTLKNLRVLPIRVVATATCNPLNYKYSENMTPNTITDWLNQASPEQREELYALAKTSKGTLRHIVDGRRNMSVTKAAVIEEATIELNKIYPDLPPVLRTSSCSACGSCPYAKKCGVK